MLGSVDFFYENSIFKNPYDFSPEDIGRAVSGADVQLILINTPPGDFGAGERGLASLPGREADFRAAIEQTYEYVDTLGVPNVHVMGGCPPAEAEPSYCRSILEENVAYAAERLEGAGAKALLEPLNNQDNPGFFIPTSKQCVDVIRSVGHSNLGLQFDLYHSYVMGTDPAEEILRWIEHIEHVQFSDAPGRHEPGTGKIDFIAAFTALIGQGYADWVGAEYIPTGATEDSLGWKAEFEDLGGVS